ncbi:MAG: hypothetical protein QG579_146 [Patescibacteria group bacterium]|jgi:DNA-binding transcriptional MerR regulator|nr:hypothetical protein [Patescibacteria group bacterium]
MGKVALSKAEIKEIIGLRKTGHSLNEIKSIVNRGYGTIFRYIKGVEILPQHEQEWKIKRGGSRKKSQKEWEEARTKADALVGDFGLKERMLVLSCLYWGEGNKREFNVINGDPTLIRVIVSCLEDLGVSRDEIKVSLRLFSDIGKTEAVNFWTKELNLIKNSITKFEIIEGKKKGKLRYGMCRVRIKKGGKHFKLIMSMIDLIRLKV